MATTLRLPFTVVCEDTNRQVFTLWTTAPGVPEAAQEVGRRTDVDRVLAIFSGQVTNLYDPEAVGPQVEAAAVQETPERDEECLDCLDKGWEVFNEDEHCLGEVQRCDACGRLPDDSAAFEAARAAGFLLDEEGRVLCHPPTLQFKAAWTEGRLEGRTLLTMLEAYHGIETLGCFQGAAYVRCRHAATEPSSPFPGVRLTHVLWEVFDNGGEVMVEPVNRSFIPDFPVQEGIPYTCFGQLLDPQTLAYRISCRIKGQKIDWTRRCSD